MTGAPRYPKRLIEVDLPIARISAHARREKSIRHGHISTLHIWWARRPLAACRAVICAALWPDPADSLCPQEFRDAAAKYLLAFARRMFPEKLTGEQRQLQDTASPESLSRWQSFLQSGVELDPNDAEHQNVLRFALLDFIADFANWANATVPAYLETSRLLTEVAHEALGGVPGTRPLVVDPFAGGGSIPLESLRVGADAFASDLNPVAVLLNKVVLEYIPKYGMRLAEEVRKWGAWIKREAEHELGEFYPNDSDGATPIAYLWARTIKCEGPGCGAEVPLLRSLWLARKNNRSIALRLIPNSKEKRVDFDIIVKQPRGWVSQSDLQSAPLSFDPDGTVKRGSATCPCCGYTTAVTSVRTQLRMRAGGSGDARMFAVVLTRPNEQGRSYRLPTTSDLNAVRKAAKELDRRRDYARGNTVGASLSLVPEETISPNELRRISVPIYGMACWGDLFSPRQLLVLTTIADLICRSGEKKDSEFAGAIRTLLALALNKQADLGCALTRWKQDAECPVNLFGRQAIGMVWDFAETAVLSASSGSWESMFERTAYSLESAVTEFHATGHIEQASATIHPLPNDSASAIVTDPPYYDAVPYAYLSDFFFVWMRRTLAGTHPGLFRDDCVPKDAEIVVDRPHQLSQSKKDVAFYERELQKAFAESRRVLRPDGIGTIVFASKTTSSWEAILKATVDAGWVITGSWPIDTEMETRVSAQGQARLASSVHLVCRPREDASGAVKEEVGEWRDVLSELPKRIHEWMPRLAAEGVVGADAIFACLGPALEIFSRYSRVEKADGSPVPLKDYLTEVWAAVSTEALSMIFQDADAAGLEPDARLTAMWLWTLGGGAAGDNGKVIEGDSDDDAGDDDDETASPKAKTSGGFSLEFDAARKIAQGLGIHLERSESIVEVLGDKARLIPVSERTRYLFGKDEASAVAVSGRKAKKTKKQMSLFEELEAIEAEDETAPGTAGIKPSAGETVLDRVHQAMILFAGGRGEALRRFVVDDGAGADARFWKLAQSLSALYPKDTDEKRWVDGVLARKKGLGF